MLFTDQLKRQIDLPGHPEKIISLVPSQTELLCDLGLEDKLTGITKFCVHPHHLRKTKQIIGGTKNLHIEQIKQLQPHLIIANKEENEQKDIGELEKHFPVWISDIRSFDDALEMIDMLGSITDTETRSGEIAAEINASRASYSVSAHAYMRTAYLIWKDPYMVAGGNTFIHEMMKLCGLENVFAHIERYPEITIDGLKAEKPELILLSSEPYPFKEKHIAELHTNVPSARILLANGEMFSWYGSRLRYAFRYFEDLWKQMED